VAWGQRVDEDDDHECTTARETPGFAQPDARTRQARSVWRALPVRPAAARRCAWRSSSPASPVKT